MSDETVSKQYNDAGLSLLFMRPSGNIVVIAETFSLADDYQTVVDTLRIENRYEINTHQLTWLLSFADEVDQHKAMYF